LQKQTSQKYPIHEESLRKFLIQKEPIDEELWEKIKEKGNGKKEERESAITLIFSNYRKVPIEADDLLRNLASQEQPMNVRERLAIRISKDKTKIPASLYFDLIETLSRDPEAKIREIVLPEIQEWLKPLTEMQKTLKAIKDFQQKPIYKEFEFNWLTFLTLDQMLTLLGMHKKGKDEEIKKMLMIVTRNESFFKNFLKDLSGIPIFKPRLRVLKEGLRAHVDGRFALSIPCMLAQIEGILWDIAYKKGFAVGTTIITSKGKQVSVKGAYLLVDQTPLYDLMTDYLAEFFLQKIYTHKFRHSVLHGRNPNYDNAEDSMKLVMLLRALSEIGKNC